LLKIYAAQVSPKATTIELFTTKHHQLSLFLLLLQAHPEMRPRTNIKEKKIRVSIFK
jgi:hypothetical protein